MWRICDLIAKGGTLVTSHAWSGCDTTSATFGQGKTNHMKNIQVSEEVRQISLLMGDPCMTAEAISKAGVRLFVILFGGKQDDSLNYLQYVKFLEMASSSKAIDPQKLPPTERAAHFHSLKVSLTGSALEEAHT